MIVTDKNTLVELLMNAGLGRSNATLAIPFMWFRPATTDPDSPVIILMIQAVQEQLHCLGVQTSRDGRMDAQTDQALKLIVDPKWKECTWTRVFQAVNAAREAHKETGIAPVLVAEPPPEATELPSWVPWAAAGGLLFLLLTR